MRERTCSTPNADIGRMKRQQAFIASMVNKVSQRRHPHPARPRLLLPQGRHRLVVTDPDLASLSKLAEPGLPVPQDRPGQHHVHHGADRGVRARPQPAGLVGLGRWALEGPAQRRAAAREVPGGRDLGRRRRRARGSGSGSGSASGSASGTASDSASDSASGSPPSTATTEGDGAVGEQEAERQRPLRLRVRPTARPAPRCAAAGAPSRRPGRSRPGTACPRG